LVHAALRYCPSKLATGCESAFLSSLLTSVCVPASLSSIEGSSLAGMSSITIKSGSDRLCVDSSFLYDFGRPTRIRYFGEDLEAWIPSGVAIIDESSLCDSHIHKIRIPKSVQILDQSCFSKCENLEFVEFEMNSLVYRIESFAFA
jgi:hypothetical protein